MTKWSGIPLTTQTARFLAFLKCHQTHFVFQSTSILRFVGVSFGTWPFKRLFPRSHEVKIVDSTSSRGDFFFILFAIIHFDFVFVCQDLECVILCVALIESIEAFRDDSLRDISWIELEAFLQLPVRISEARIIDNVRVPFRTPLTQSSCKTVITFRVVRIKFRFIFDSLQKIHITVRDSESFRREIISDTVSCDICFSDVNWRTWPIHVPLLHRNDWSLHTFHKIVNKNWHTDCSQTDWKQCHDVTECFWHNRNIIF